MAKSLSEKVNTLISKELPQDKNMRLFAWHELQELLKMVKKAEMEMRKEMGLAFFNEDDLTEGVNTAEIGQGWKLKNKHTLKRDIDEGSLAAVLKKMPKGSEDKLIKYKPSLVLKEYRRLSDKELKIFDEAITMKPGSLALELCPPKEK